MPMQLGRFLQACFKLWQNNQVETFKIKFSHNANQKYFQISLQKSLGFLPFLLEFIMGCIRIVTVKAK
jgi:hypothetical protein